MTVAAREVLSDCEVALVMLEEVDDLRRWRVLWAGSVALLRAVGHVLKKVDGIDPRTGRAIDLRYRDWKLNLEANAVFWEFIEKERNNVLKEYEFATSLDEEIAIILQTYSETGEVGTNEFALGENLYRPLVNGYGAGEDARDVYQEALDWWKRELAAIDEDIRTTN